MKKSCWKWFTFLFCFILMNLFLLSVSKTELGAKTAPQVPNLGYVDGRVPKLNSRATFATSGAGVVRHMYTMNMFYLFIGLLVLES